MSNYRQPFEPGIAYHIYNRGFQKQTIFPHQHAYVRFCEYITKYLDQYLDVYLLAFSLLPNHFHLLLAQTNENDDISQFMRKLQVSYAMYFKSLLGEEPVRGPVFEGRFNAKAITHDAYLDQVQLYISLNPVKHGMVEKIEDWIWTSAHTILDTGRGYGDLLPSITFPDDIEAVDSGVELSISGDELE